MSLEEANVFLNVESEKIDNDLYVIANGIKIPFGKNDNKINKISNYHEMVPF